jgi:hypothetical protein
MTPNYDALFAAATQLIEFAKGLHNELLVLRAENANLRLVPNVDEQLPNLTASFQAALAELQTPAN